MKGLDWKAIAISAILAAALVVGAGLAAWHAMGKVAPDAARAWALIATVVLPGVFWAGWRMGHTEAKGRLQGIDDGLDKIVKAADLAINARATHIVKTKEAKRDQLPVVILPNPAQLPPVDSTFTMRQQLSAGEVIELD